MSGTELSARKRKGYYSKAQKEEAGLHVDGRGQIKSLSKSPRDRFSLKELVVKISKGSWREGKCEVIFYLAARASLTLTL